MIFAILMIAAAIALVLAIGQIVGGWFALAALAVLGLAVLRLARPEDAPAPRGPRHGRNAFQRQAAKD